MNNRKREHNTINFNRTIERGSVEETFYPWTLTAKRFKDEGMPENLVNNLQFADDEKHFIAVDWGKSIIDYDNYFGFDAVRRVHFSLPFRKFEEKILFEDDKCCVKKNLFGQQVKIDKKSDMEYVEKPALTSMDDWLSLKEKSEVIRKEHFSKKQIHELCEPLAAEHEAGKYSIRMTIEGFFWCPRELLGVEPHLYAFYDEPELLHSICEYMLDVYMNELVAAVDLLHPDILCIMEDLSGANGPMISPDIYNEFVGAYYKKLIPLLKKYGVENVFVDTDGDFSQLIPNFIESGIDGFLPMDVNAGMDIVKVRKDFPTLKFIGGYNKLCIADGKDAIDKEFERILPVIRQGGYIPGADHQVAPSTSLENYKYYIQKLNEVMHQTGADIVMVKKT